MKKRERSRQGMTSPNFIKGGKLCLEENRLEVTYLLKMNRVQEERKQARRMMMWKMSHICHLSKLVLMEKRRQVPVAVG
jgi:hypothetical protein